jgi:hypothetical protein
LAPLHQLTITLRVARQTGTHRKDDRIERVGQLIERDVLSERDLRVELNALRAQLVEAPIDPETGAPDPFAYHRHVTGQ